MIIVSGHLRVDPAARQAYLDGCVEIVRAARAAHGCVDFHLSADPIEPDRINIYEQWTSDGAVAAFREAGPSDDQQAAIVGAHVEQHEIASTTRLA